MWADDSSFGGYLQSAPTVIDSGAFSSGTIASAAAAAAVPIAEQRSFYCLTTHTLAPRLALIPPLRMPPEAVPCNVLYDAPVGRVSYVVVQVPAAAALMAWQRDVAEAALRLFHAVADAGLRRLLGPQRRQQQGGGEGAACMGQRAEGAESPGPINIYKVSPGLRCWCSSFVSVERELRRFAPRLAARADTPLGLGEENVIEDRRSGGFSFSVPCEKVTSLADSISQATDPACRDN